MSILKFVRHNWLTIFIGLGGTWVLIIHGADLLHYGYSNEDAAGTIVGLLILYNVITQLKKLSRK